MKVRFLSTIVFIATASAYHPPISRTGLCMKADVRQAGGGTSRSSWLRGVASATLGSMLLATASAEAARAGVQGLPLRPPEGSCEGCVGVINGLLANCNSETNCVSSQDDRPGTFQEPWTYESSTEAAMARLRAKVEAIPGVEVVKVDGRYLRYEVTSGGGKDVDDVEFYFTPSDYTIQFRAARRTASNDRGANGKLMEKLRISLGFEKLPVMRNRKRAFFLMESPFDSFGPVYGEAVPVPEEMDRNEVFRDADPRAPIWQGPPPYPTD